jgi:RNA-binding protein 26
VDAVVLEDAGKPPVAGDTPGAPPPGEPYIPGRPGPLGVMSVPPPGYAPGIITVPPPGYLPQYGKRPHDGGMVEPAAKRFDFQRLGGARGGRGRGRGRGGRGGAGASSMLAVRNIPPELNTITHLNGHFSRYGNLINVQVQFEGDPGSALVTYGNGDEANSAFATSEAVMNNRFIKVFWHKDMGSLKDRLGNPNMADKQLTRTITNDGETTGEAEGEDSPEKAKERKEKQIEAIQENQKMMQMKHEMLKKADEKRKEALVQQEGLIKSKQTLMEGLIEQQKMLIMKLEKGKGTIKVEEKSKIMKLLKELSSSIDRTKEDIKMSLSMVKSKSRSELQKELLDAEMELFTRQQDDEDTAEIQAKVNSLRLEAARSGVLPTSRGRGRGRGYRGGRGSPRGGGFMRGRGGRGRGFTLSPGGQCVDRRPSRILVSGYELEEKEELVVHFAKFGEILEQVEDEVRRRKISSFSNIKF